MTAPGDIVAAAAEAGVIMPCSMLRSRHLPRGTRRVLHLGAVCYLYLEESGRLYAVAETHLDGGARRFTSR